MCACACVCVCVCVIVNFYLLRTVVYLKCFPSLPSPPFLSPPPFPSLLLPSLPSPLPFYIQQKKTWSSLSQLSQNSSYDPGTPMLSGTSPHSLGQTSSDRARDLGWSSTYQMVGNHGQREHVGCNSIGCYGCYLLNLCLM